MSEEELNEAMQYNLDYTEAMLSDELFGNNEVAEVKLLASEKTIKDLQQKVEQLEKENEKLKHKLNDIAFGDDSELALRFLRRIGYVGFDEKRKVYINKHNNEPFLWKDEQEKDYYLKDEELNEYTQQLEYKVEQLENIRKEIKEYIEKHVVCCKNGDMLVELNANDLLNILNKGSNKNE